MLSDRTLPPRGRLLVQPPVGKEGERPALIVCRKNTLALTVDVFLQQVGVDLKSRVGFG
jgi:hypothetical protein